jgi:hypothetical protein
VTAGRWLEPALLDLLPHPPMSVVSHPGGRLVHVVEPSSGRWHPAIVLAWARLPGGGWACLMVWSAGRRAEGGRAQGYGRWSWCRYDPRRVRPGGEVTPVPNPWGMKWFGQDVLGRMSAAIAEALLTVPEQMRDAAARPLEGRVG